MDGQKLFLVKYGDPPNDVDLRVVELDPLSLETRHEFPWSHSCQHLIQVLDESWLCTSAGGVVRLDPLTGDIVKKVADFDQPGVVVASQHSPDGDTVQLAIQNEAVVSLVEVNLETGRVRALLELRPPDGWIYVGREFAMAGDGALLYIGVERREGYDGYPDQVWCLRITDGEIIARINIDGEIDDLKVGPGSRLFVLSGERGTLAILDGFTQREPSLVDGIGGYPAFLLIPEP